MRSCPGLAAAVDELLTVAPGDLPDAALADLLVDVDEELTRLTAAHARLAAAVETRRSWEADGSQSCAAWFARRRRGSQAASGAALRLGRALALMPATDTALAEGDLTVEHARELAGCQRFAPTEFANDEATLVGHARTMCWRDFLVVCARWRDAVNPDGADRTADQLHDRRHLVLHRRPDGSLSFQTGLLDPLGAEGIDPPPPDEATEAEADHHRALCRARLRGLIRQ